MRKLSELENILIVGVILFVVGTGGWWFTQLPLFLILSQVGNLLFVLWIINTRYRKEQENN